MTQKKKIIVAISGAGRSLKNLIDYSSTHPLCHFEVGGVISSYRGCGGEEFAEKQGIPVYTADFSKKNASIAEQLDAFVAHSGEVHLIVLAGFLKKFPVLPHYKYPIINIHPALLPKFGGKGMYGMAVHKAVAASDDKMSGATIHFVTEDYDKGRIIARYCVPIEDIKESPEQIAQRVFAGEKLLLPHIIDQLISGEIDPHSKKLPLTFFEGDIST